MQTYAEYLKPILDKYKFYRNVDIFEKMDTLLNVDELRPIIKNDAGEVYCSENSLRIFIGEGKAARDITSLIRTDKRYNYVVVYLEGEADISNMFEELKCNTLITVCLDDSYEIKASHVFEQCQIRTAIISVLTLTDVEDFFGGCNIGQCSFHDVSVKSVGTKDIHGVIARGSEFNLLNIGNITFTCDIGNKPLLHTVEIGKLYVTSCDNVSAYVGGVSEVCYYVADSFAEWLESGLVNTSSKVDYVSILEEVELNGQELSYLEGVKVLSTKSVIYINDSVVDEPGHLLPNSFDNVKELDSKDDCKLQCAAHFVKGTKCYTYINPDLKYAILHLPPVEEVEISGPWNIVDLVINSCGIVPKITYKGELKKSIDKYSCQVHKMDGVTLCNDVVKSNDASSTFSSMFSKVIAKADPLYTNVENVCDRIIHYAVEDIGVIIK